MRRINPFLASVLIAGAMAVAAQPSVMATPDRRKPNEKRQTKAQKKRERKARQRANLAAANASSNS